jgi:hypothetical protein
MAAVSLSDCKVYKKLEGDYTSVMIVSPSTMDSADTIDVSALVADGQVLQIYGWDVEGGDAATATYATGTGIITVDAAGGTVNHTYAVEIKFVGFVFTP